MGSDSSEKRTCRWKPDESDQDAIYNICHWKHALITWEFVMVGAEVRALALAQLCTHTDAMQWRPFLGPTQRTSRACLRRDSRASETAWQIWAWPPRRERKGANWIYIFVFNPPYTPHWFYSSSECRLHVCIYRKRGNTKNMACVSDISAFALGTRV